jgi:hypothetical protein
LTKRSVGAGQVQRLAEPKAAVRERRKYSAQLENTPGACPNNYRQDENRQIITLESSSVKQKNWRGPVHHSMLRAANSMSIIRTGS